MSKRSSLHLSHVPSGERGWRDGMLWRRRSAVLSAMGGALAAIGAAPGRVWGQSAQLARATRGPYVQQAAPDGITVLWHTDTPVVPSVEYRPERPAGSGESPDPWTVVGGGGRARTHAIRLTGLLPGTAYRYRVFGDGRLLSEGGPTRTLPAPDVGALSFAVYGDTRTNHSPHEDVVRSILRQPHLPELLLHAGDFVESGQYADQWDTFFRIEHDLLSRVSLFPAIGNHEENHPLYFQSFRVPGNGTTAGEGRWYSFDAGPAHFIALDVVFSDFEPGSPQYRWLEQDLRRTTRLWKFVFFHYPPYNASQPHGPNLRVRAALEHLFVEHRVSIVFASHAHVYERARGATAGPELPSLIHILTGGGGAPLHAVSRDPSTQYAEPTYHFVRVVINGSRITTTGVRPDGTEFDRFDGRLDDAGRVEAVTPLALPVVVSGPSITAFAASPQGAMVAGYTAVWGAGAPLGLSAAAYGRRRPVVPVPSGAIAPPPRKVEDPYAGWKGLPVVLLVSGLAAVVLAMILLTAPLHWLLGFDTYTLILTAHAVLGTALVVVATIAASMGYRLAIHHLPSFGWLMGMASAAAALAGTLAILGNILYAGYLRSGGPMEQLIKKAPEAHKVLFEFKEYVGLFPFPLAVAAAFIVWFYREDLRRDRQLAEMVAVLLLLVVFFSLLPFGLGAAVVRLRGIL